MYGSCKLDISRLQTTTYCDLFWEQGESGIDYTNRPVRIAP